MHRLNGLCHPAGLDAPCARIDPCSFSTNVSVNPLNVGSSHPARAVVRVADGVSRYRPLSTDLADSCHPSLLSLIR